MENIISLIYLFLFFICAIGLLFSFYMLYRNKKTYKFKKEILDKINKLASRDIDSKREFQWRYIEYDKVSYDYIVEKFWVPLKVENFWKDLSFITEER